MCAAPAYLEGRKAPREPSDLLEHECLLYSQQVDGSAWRFAVGVTVNARGRVRANSGDALLASAVAAMGVVWLPDFYVHDALADGRLVPLLEDYEADPLGIWVLYPDRRHPSLKLRLAIEALTEAMAQG